jgi:CBS domain-containing protein
MRTTSEPLLALVASDVMSQNLLRLTEDMPLREVARLLLQRQVSGAPVVDADGRCVGILSATDFLRLAQHREDVTHPASPPLPLTCSYLKKHRMLDGREVFLCLLPEGICPLQHKEQDPGNNEVLTCSQPHCVLLDWQQVDVEQLPVDAVREFMTPNPVTASPDTPIRELAREMIDAHIHRIVVVDEERQPIGIVTSTDILAAIAYAD